MLRDWVKIDRRFQNSVNLYLDIDNTVKIDSYIYTRSSGRIIDYYMENVNKNREQATILIGPYGKGKSHLLLVLIDKLKHLDKPYLPVIISGTNEDLNQAFLFGITDALKRAGLEQLAPASYYSEAVRRIEEWKQNFPDAYRLFCHNAGIHTDEQAEEYENRLNRHDAQYLEEFRRIYPKVTSGSIFQPIIMLETVRIYEEIKRELADKYGYAGIYVIFDEFSKYIEGHGAEGFARDMKVLQDMCELAADSTDARMFITFVAHKSIKEYGANLPKDMLNAYRGVEGRVKEVLFVVSSQNNYELIGNVLKKDEDVLSRIRDIERYYSNAMAAYTLPCFSGLFSEEDYRKYVAEGCFPLVPLAAYMLLHISGKVAQNERSLFTYLTHDEKGSLYRLVKECQDDEADYGITADSIYDYFRSLFREEDSGSLIHNEWLKAEYAISKTENPEEKKLIKVMALIDIIDRPDELSAGIVQLASALNMTADRCQKVIDSLIAKKLIVYRPRKQAYCFYNNVGVDIEKELSKRAAGLGSFADIVGTLKKISEMDYVLPKKHNQDYSITRYFEYVFMTPEQIRHLQSVKLLFEEHFSDGKIIAVVSEADELEDENVIISRLQDDRVVVLMPTVGFTQSDNIRKYIVAQKLLVDKEFIEDNVVLEQELRNYCDDIAYEVNAFIENAYNPQNGRCRVFHGDECYAGGFRQGMTFNMFLSCIMTEYYNYTPVINNELINRRNISAQNKKARNKIIDMLLSGKDCSIYESTSSPEATIYRAVLYNTGAVKDNGEVEPGCERIITEIDRFITQCDGNRCSFKLLYDRLTGVGFGARKGIIPIYIALCFSRLADMPIVSLKEKELEIDSSILGNVNEYPEDYFLYVEHETMEKQKYLADMEKLFNAESAGNGRGREKHILDSVLSWYRSLPQAAVNVSICPKGMDELLFNKVRSFGSLLRRGEYNPHQFLFEQLSECTNVEKDAFADILNNVRAIKSFMDGYLQTLMDCAAKIIKNRCRASENDSLRAVLDNFYHIYGEKMKVYVTKSKTMSILSYLSDIPTYDENEIISRLSKLVLDIYIEDWKDGMTEKFREEWQRLCDEVESYDRSGAGQSQIILKKDGQEQLERSYDDSSDDSTGYFLKNAIKEAIDEFGDSLETNEKVAVLARVLAEIVAGEV